MPRSQLSSDAIEAMLASSTDAAMLLLLTVSHASLPASLLFVNNTEDIVSRGDTYLACPFRFIMPSDFADRAPEAAIEIDNVDRRITDALRSLSTTPTLRFEIILAESPDDVEWGPVDMQLADPSYDSNIVRASLTFGNSLENAWPKDRFLPIKFPGLFRTA